MTSTPTFPDHSAAPRRSLDPQRTDQIRSFLVVEAAAAAARRPPVLTPARRRLVVGAAAALLLSGGLVAVQSVGGPAPAAIAVEVDGEWTTVRLVDIDADPDAVVAQLRDAGFAAERQTLEVVDSGDGSSTMSHVTDERDSGAGVVAFAHGEEGGAHGLVGLSVTLPEGLTPAPPAPPGAPEAGGTEVGTEPAAAQATEDGIAVVEDDLLDAGIRFEDDGGVSLRTGTDVTIVVSTER